MGDVTLRHVGLDYRGVLGAMQALDTSMRDLYKQAAGFHATDALKRLQQTKTLVAGDAPWAAKTLSEYRNLLRAATQGKLTPLGRTLSKYLEQDRSWQQIIQKYGDPFDFTKSEAARLASAEKIIEKAGASSTAANGLQLFGKALFVINVALCVWQVREGVAKQGTRDAGVGKVDIAQGSTNAILAIGSYVATKAGWLTTAGGWAGVGASMLAVGSLSLAAEETKRSIRGQKTMIVEANDYYTDLYRRGSKEGGAAGLMKQAGAVLGGGFTWPLAWVQTGGEMR